MLNRLMIVLALLTAAVAFPAIQGAAEGSSPGQLEDAGWTCIVPVPGDNIHCAPPGGLDRVVAHEAELMTFKVFDAGDESYIGTEQIIREDLFHGQPCPTDPPSRQYTDLEPILGLRYFACHRYDSSF